MYTFAQALNIGKWLKTKTAVLPATITAAAGNDGQAVNGLIIDREALGYNLAMGGKLCIGYVATINTAEKLTAAVKIQHGSASNGSDMADYVDSYGHGALASADVMLGAQTAAPGVLEIDVALDGAKRYIRCVTTFDLSRTGTDTVAVSGMWVFGGLQALPQPDLSYSVTA
jgi:hypothetical protein